MEQSKATALGSQNSKEGWKLTNKHFLEVPNSESFAEMPNTRPYPLDILIWQAEPYLEMFCFKQPQWIQGNKFTDLRLETSRETRFKGTNEY